MLYSTLFGGNSLLEDIAGNVTGARISCTQNRNDPAVMLIQLALLIWSPGCLPVYGADGKFGSNPDTSETANAVFAFKRDVLGVPVGSIIKDVGPETVKRLDEIAYDREQQLGIQARSADIDSWLTPGLSGVFSAVSNSDIIVHTTGESAFLSLHNAITSCVDDRAIIVISGWDFQETCPVAPGVTIGDSLRAAAGRGAAVRALINHFPVIHIPGITSWQPPGFGDNQWAVAFFNGLPGGAAIHDGRTLHHTPSSLGIPVPGVLPIQLGVHHQKAWAVWNGQTLTAWCGGMDLNANRTGPGGLHDVQLELHGQAAADVYSVMRLRWEDHPNRPPGVSLPTLLATTAHGNHRTRVTTTFGDPTQFAGLLGSPYSFAPRGSKATRELLFHMIRKSQHFIYVEDQYFVDPDVGQELANAMPHLSGLVILFCDSNLVNGELRQAFERRRKALAPLAPHMAKIAIVTRNNRFVHSKTWIFDDTMVMVGSTNLNRRGLQHDSEMGVAYGDLQGTETARDLRERLWKMHLGSFAPASGTDPVSALPLWKSPPGSSGVVTYDPAVGTDSTPVPSPLNLLLNKDQFWDIVDPACP